MMFFPRVLDMPPLAYDHLGLCMRLIIHTSGLHSPVPTSVYLHTTAQWCDCGGKSCMNDANKVGDPSEL